MLPRIAIRCVRDRVFFKNMAQVSQKDLGIVIVSWNVRDLLLQNLERLHQNQGMSLEVIVVDNASKDGTVEAVKALYPEMIVIANKENSGFSKACNQGIVASNARHMLLLNPDMMVEPDALIKTVTFLDTHPDVAVVSGKLLSKNGKLMHHMRRFPTVSDQMIVMCKLSRLIPRCLDRYHAVDLNPESEQVVDTVRGSYFAINRTALDTIGLLDERYYIWFEEVDYCKQVQKHKMKVMYVPTIIARDLVGQSFKQVKLYRKQSLFLRSMRSYFEKWHPGWRAWIIRAVQPVILIITKVAESISQ